MIKLHAGQSEVYEDLFVYNKIRFAVVVCARGWGKSYCAAVAATTAIFELLTLRETVPNKKVYIIAPTYDQVTDIYYPLLAYELGLVHYCKNSSRALGRFVFDNGVELHLISYEAIERMRGKGAYFVVWDEISSCTKGMDPKAAWEDIIQPCIVTRWSQKNALRHGSKSAGRALIISTPKGFNYLHSMYHMKDSNSLWGGYHYDYRHSPFLDPDEIEPLQHILDPVAWASEYLASFKDSGSSVFYCFDRDLHVRELPYFEPKGEEDYGEDVHLGIDFNVGIQCTSAFALRGHQMHFLDEFKGQPNTESLAAMLKEKYVDKGHRVFAYPDPTGRARKTSAPVGVTDFSILRSYGIECLARQKSPPIADSVNAVNRKLKTAAGDVSMFVSPKCKGLIESLERTVWVDRNPDTATIDKSAGVEHFSDGVRYPTEFLFPVQAGNKVVIQGHNF